MEHPKWFLMWSKPKGAEYITSACAWTRKDLVLLVEREWKTDWKTLYKRGARLVRVTMTIDKK